jgi:transcriptional regulator with XRE-family HTH domain
MSIFATRLRSLRAEYNISMKTLAKHINATDTAVSNWENNINEPKISYVISIAKFFNVSTDYLLGMDEETNTKTQ